MEDKGKGKNYKVTYYSDLNSDMSKGQSVSEITKNLDTISKTLQSELKKVNYAREAIKKSGGSEEIDGVLKKSDKSLFSYRLNLIADELAGARSVSERAIEYILSHLNDEYQFIQSTSKASEESGMSAMTILRALRSLCDCNPPVMSRISQSVWQVNDYIINEINEYGKKGGRQYDRPKTQRNRK